MRRLASDRRALFVALIAVASAVLGGGITAAASTPTEVSFATADGGEIHANLYGDGAHAVVLAHGAVFDKESWEPLASPLMAAGFRVLAIDFRGYGQSRPGTEGEARYLDILGALEFLRGTGVERVSVVGASLGGGAAARAAVQAGRGEIDRLILLAPVAIPNPEQMHAGQFVYITAEGDPSVGRTRALYEQAPEPKRLEILPGDAHAQHLFKSEHSQALVDAVLAALAD